MGRTATKRLLLEEKVGGFSRSDEARNPPLPVADIGRCSANEATSFASVIVAKRLCRIVRVVGCEAAVIITIQDNAAAAATALTIRHSRFAALTLAKLVASLALHPPVSATEADYAPHHRLRRSLSSRRSLLVIASMQQSGFAV